MAPISASSTIHVHATSLGAQCRFRTDLDLLETAPATFRRLWQGQFQKHWDQGLGAAKEHGAS